MCLSGAIKRRVKIALLRKTYFRLNSAGRGVQRGVGIIAVEWTIELELVVFILLVVVAILVVAIIVILVVAGAIKC